MIGLSINVYFSSSGFYSLWLANLADSQCNGEHMAGPASHEVPVYPNVLLQELPQHRQDQQLHQLPELLPTKGTSNTQNTLTVTYSLTHTNCLYYNHL